MHEFSIATSIVEAVLEFAARQRARKVVEVRLLVGELTCVEAGQLRFCFEAITEDSVLAEARLEIDTARAEVRCPHCAYEGAPKYWDAAQTGAQVPTLACPSCGRAAEAISGHDCAIRSVKFQREEDGLPPEAEAA